MSLTSVLSPVTTLSSVPNSPNPQKSQEGIAFHHQPTYISLSRLLTRYQHIVLLHPPSDTLSTIQQQTQSDLRSSLPYHRTKWLHNVEYCRTLLLRLEHAAQSIRIQSQKRAAVHDLAEKRAVIKRLRRRIEDLGREAEATASNQPWSHQHDHEEDGGETLEQILGRPPLAPEPISSDGKVSQVPDPEGELKDGKAVRFIEPTPSLSTSSPPSTPNSPSSARDHLFSTNRRRKGQPTTSTTDSASSSGFTSLPTTESSLTSANRTHDSLTSSLVTLASQLKSQSLAFQTHLSNADATLLDRALTGLDQNLTQMANASKGMAFVRRMSEGQGWLGRLKLYAMIFALWIVVILLVFVGPKLRF